MLTSPLLSTPHLHPPTYQPPIKLFSSFSAFCSKYIVIKIEFLPNCFSLQTFPLDAGYMAGDHAGQPGPWLVQKGSFTPGQTSGVCRDSPRRSQSQPHGSSSGVCTRSGSNNLLPTPALPSSVTSSEPVNEESSPCS